MRLPVSARTEGLSAERRWSRVSTTRARPRAIHSKMARMNTALITSSTESRSVPIVIARLLSAVSVGDRRPVMSRAATTHAIVATARASNGSRNSSADALITIHSPVRLVAMPISRYWPPSCAISCSANTSTNQA